MKTILVTGAAGFIGSHLCEKLLLEKYEVIGLDNLNNFYDPKIKKNNLKQLTKHRNFKFVRADILNSHRVTRTFSAYKPRVVVHLAAYAGVRPSIGNPVLYTQVNVNGTLNILEQIRRFQIENYIFASSSSVYGNNDKIPFSENDRVDHPISPYALTKRAAELLCQTYANLYKIPTTVLRFFTVYGPRQRPDLAIHKFMKRIILNQTIELYGNGKSERDYTYIDDTVDGIIRAIKTPKQFEIVNLGNSHPISLINLVKLIEKTLEKKAKNVWQPFQLGDVNKTFADITKAKSLYGWNPKTEIESGLRKMAFWIKDMLESSYE